MRLPISSAYHLIVKVGDADQICSMPFIAQFLSVDFVQEWSCMFKTLALFSAILFIIVVLILLLVEHLRLAGVVGALYLILGMVLTRAIMK